MPKVEKEKDWKTLLVVSEGLRNRILGQADLDRRQYKAEIIVLLEEALKARELKT